MPDGDIVHAKLSRFYQKPYQWLCEGVASLDECASKLIKEKKLDHPCEHILENYMNEVYLSSFKERIPKTDRHYNNIDEKTLSEKIARIEPTIESSFKSWSKKLSTDGSFSQLKNTIAGRKVTVYLEENLL